MAGEDAAPHGDTLAEGPWGDCDEDPALAEPGGTLHPPGAWPHPGPTAQTCPLRDLEEGPLAQTQTLRDFEKVTTSGVLGHLNDLKKENFSLKLRIYFLEERVQQKGEGSRDDVYRRVSAPMGTGLGTGTGTGMGMGMGTGCCCVLDFPPVLFLCQERVDGEEMGIGTRSRQHGTGTAGGHRAQQQGWGEFASRCL
uniref:Centrosomin N-terminal motif 1 domain-containing protein n=1 Tax=Anas platyrhynchos platyrhynchos TaxID=8840 RepID=A0A493TXY3_ANAPP